VPHLGVLDAEIETALRTADLLGGERDRVRVASMVGSRWRRTPDAPAGTS
jgi:hypothetical protein